MSWAPYWWPDCSNVHNTTELTPQEIWKECNYVSRDGKFNPDGRAVNDVGNFQSLSDMVFYNSLAFALTGNASNRYSQSAVKYIQTWFLDPDTKMNPNLNYAQMNRGPTGQTGTHTGILDLKGMAKITTGILIFRKKGCTDWTSDIDNQMVAWTKEYIQWLETAPISLEEEAATNNHGSFWYNQVAALKLLVDDTPGALNVTNTYFNAQYKSQIEANGEQPLEAARTRPYHYHAYNLAAMIVNARIQAYAGDKTVWNKTTNQGSTIKTALDFAMTLNSATSGETNYTAELYPSVAAVGAIYGDTDQKYSTFLANGVPGSNYAEEAYFLWDQPLAGGEKESQIIASKGTSTSSSSSSNPSGGSKKAKDNGAVSFHGGIAAGLLATFLMLVTALAL